ncbi:hypothetical protein HMN09_00120500 [Mycena chlorophos]|uniref:Uncharacterized protein n=1 Tax=Mycena chlorophos TaxID=658473 RepID=A0A8H6TVC2_MYCCL|nr:hypothetical protein HMN09_00120500 [Mycena chlorophos]
MDTALYATADDPQAGPMPVDPDECEPHLFSFSPGAYPSPPDSQSAKSVPLPTDIAIGGILDSPIVYIKPTTQWPLSPPPTTRPLPYLLPIADPALVTESHLLSPISPELPSSRPFPESAATDGASVLMSQTAGATDTGGYSIAMGIGATVDATPYARRGESLSPLDLLIQPDGHLEVDSLGLAAFAAPLSPSSSPESELMPSPLFEPSSLEQGDVSDDSPLFPPSLLSSPAIATRQLDDLQFDEDDEFPSLFFSSPKLVSFASLPSPELDDLDIDMDLSPGPSPASPSRRSVAALPLFDDDVPRYEFGCADFVPTDAPQQVNALGVDLPTTCVSIKPPYISILDAYSPAELSARLPPCLPHEELDALLVVRKKALDVLEDCATEQGRAVAKANAANEAYHEPNTEKIRRKRAKHLARETDSLLGLGLGIIPGSDDEEQLHWAPPHASSSESEPDLPASDLDPDAADADSHPSPPDNRSLRLAPSQLESVHELVARMIFRRRASCVRKASEQLWRARRDGGGSHLRNAVPVDVDEEDEGREPTSSSEIRASPMELDLEIDAFQ